MSEIGSKISFGANTYDVNRENKATPPNAVRLKFADKLAEISKDGTIDQKEKDELEAISKESGASASEISISAQISGTGKLAFDADAKGDIAPVEVSFNLPGKNGTNPTGGTTATKEVEASRYNGKRIAVSIGSGDSKFDLNVSQRMAFFLDQAVKSGKGIGYEEFTRLAEIIKATGSEDDAMVLALLADAASSQKDSKKATLPIKIGSGEEKNIRIKDQPDPEGKAGEGKGWGGFLTKFFNETLPGIAGDFATTQVKDALNKVGKKKTPTP